MRLTAVDADVVVIGGGLQGLATTYYLSKAGKSVILIENREIASGASGTNEAFVWLSTRKKPEIPMVRKSIELYLTLSEELEFDTEYRRCGGYIIIESKEQMEQIKPWIERRHSDGLVEMELLDGPEFHSREPYMAESIVAATWNPLDGAINPIYLCIGLADKSKELGARILERTVVKEICIKGSAVHSVITDEYEIRTGTVVNACGAWASDIGKMVGIDIPIVPNRMQILVSEPIDFPLSDRVIMCACYIFGEAAKTSALESGDASEEDFELGFVYSQTKKGNLLLGSTAEFAGYDKSCTYGSITAIAKHTCQVAPLLKERKLSIIRSFANFFPFTRDDFPILGKVPNLRGFYMAAGHNGHGIASGISTGYLMSQLITLDETSIPISQFSIERFN